MISPILANDYLAPDSLFETKIDQAIQQGRVFQFRRNPKRLYPKWDVFPIVANQNSWKVGERIPTFYYSENVFKNFSHFDSIQVIFNDGWTFFKDKNGLWIGQELLNYINLEFSVSNLRPRNDYVNYPINQIQILLDEMAQEPYESFNLTFKSVIDQLRQELIVWKKFNLRLIQAIEEDQDLTPLWQENAEWVRIVLINMAQGKMEGYEHLIEKARKIIIPHLIYRQDLRVQQIRLSPYDVTQIIKKPYAKTSDYQLFLAKLLSPQYTQKGIESEKVLSELLESENESIKLRALTSLQEMLTLSDDQLRFKNSPHHKNQILYYFLSPETIRQILYLIKDPSLNVKLKAIEILYIISKVNVFYIMNALNINALTVSDQYHLDYELLDQMMKIFKNKNTILANFSKKDRDRMMVMIKDFIMNYFSELVRWTDYKGVPLIEKEKVNEIVSLIIEEIREATGKDFYPLLQTYAQMNTGFLAGHINNMCRLFYQFEISLTKKLHIIRALSKIRRAKDLYPFVIQDIDRFMLKILLDRQMTYLPEDKESYRLNAKTGVLDLQINYYWDQIVRIQDGGDIDFQIGSDVILGPHTLNQQEISHIVRDEWMTKDEIQDKYYYRFHLEGYAYPVYLTLELDQNQTLTPNTDDSQLMKKWYRETLLKGKIVKIELSDMQEAYAVGDLSLVNASEKILVEAMTAINFSKNSDAAERLVELLQDPSPYIRYHAWRNITSNLIRNQSVWEEIYQIAQSQWGSENDVRVLVAMVSRLGFIYQGSKGFYVGTQARQLLLDFYQEYQKRSDPNIHVLNTFHYVLKEDSMDEYNPFEELMLNQGMIDISSSHQDLQDLIQLIKQYFKKFDVEFDTTHDEDIYGQTISNLVENSLINTPLLKFFGTLKHEVRHRNIAATNITYKQNEFLSRIEDAISIKIYEWVRSQQSDPEIIHQFDLIIDMRRYQLGSFNHEIYGDQNQEMDSWLKVILDVPITSLDWKEKINDYLAQAEKMTGIFVPRITDSEIQFLKTYLKADDFIENIPNPYLKLIATKILRVTKLTLKYYYSSQYNLAQFEKISRMIAKMFVYEFMRTHLLLEEDLIQRMYEKVDIQHRPLIHQSIQELTESFYDPESPITGQHIWDLFLLKLRTDPSVKLNPDERRRLFESSWPIFSYDLGSYLRGNQYFSQISRALFENPSENRALSFAMQLGVLDQVALSENYFQLAA